MEDLTNLLYNIIGEFGKPSSPIFVFGIYLSRVLLFKARYLDNSKLNNIIYYKLQDYMKMFNVYDNES